MEGAVLVSLISQTKSAHATEPPIDDIQHYLNANVANLVCIEMFAKLIDRMQSTNIINCIALLSFDFTWIWISKSTKNTVQRLQYPFLSDVWNKHILHSLYTNYLSDAWKKVHS